MKWLTIDEKYLDYMRSKEPRIPKSNYGVNSYKPFFGKLFEDGDLVYVTQVSHPKERHYKLKSSLDFIKVYELNNKNHLLSVVNLNYMFPVPRIYFQYLEYADIEKHRNFANKEERNKYISLLIRELNALNNMNIDKKAIKIYNNKYSKPDSSIAKRCFDFKQLEIYANEYKE